jgi:hypothetical protein
MDDSDKPKKKVYHEPPTLPLPPLWRIVVALAAIVGFLYFLYHYEANRPPEPSTGLGLPPLEVISAG